LSTLLPPVLLLCWSGIAATTLTGLVAAPLLGEPFASFALGPRRPSTAGALWLGLALYPLAYALGFAALGKATIITGAVLGLAHAAVLAILALRLGGRALVAASTRRMLLCVCYGAVLGFAVVTS